MTKQPFDKNGIEAKQQELYALPEAQQKKETTEIRSDFKGWIIANFLLSDSQIDFVNHLDPVLVKSIDSEIAISIEHELPIHLQLPNPTDGGSKFMVKEEGLKPIQTEQGVRYEGNLRITIGYRQ